MNIKGVVQSVVHEAFDTRTALYTLFLPIEVDGLTNSLWRVFARCVDDNLLCSCPPSRVSKDVGRYIINVTL